VVIPHDGLPLKPTPGSHGAPSGLLPPFAPLRDGYLPPPGDHRRHARAPAETVGPRGSHALGARPPPALILGEDARALKAFDAAIFRGGADSDLFYHRGLAKEGLGDYAGALVDFRRAVALKPEDGNAHRNIGYVLLQVDRSEEATVALEEAIRLDPADSKAWLNLGTAYANVDEAVRKELKELRPPPAGQVPADDPQLRRQRELNDKLREFDYRAHALAAYREAVRIEPGNAEYWYNLGTLLHEQRGDLAEAIDALARAAALSAPDYRVLRNLANAQQDARRFREALETTDKIAVTYGEQDAWLLELRGSLQVELGDLPSAERSYLLAVEADPDGAGPHVGLAILYKRQKLDVESATHLRTAQRLRPELAHYFEMVLQHEP